MNDIPDSGLSRTGASPARHLWHSVFPTSGTDTWGVARLLDLRGSHPRKESGSTTDPSIEHVTTNWVGDHWPF